MRHSLVRIVMNATDAQIKNIWYVFLPLIFHVSPYSFTCFSFCTFSFLIAFYSIYARSHIPLGNFCNVSVAVYIFCACVWYSVAIGWNCCVNKFFPFAIYVYWASCLVVYLSLHDITKTTFCSFRPIIDLIFGQIEATEYTYTHIFGMVDETMVKTDNVFDVPWTLPNVCGGIFVGLSYTKLAQ